MKRDRIASECNLELSALFRRSFPSLPQEENFSFARHTTIGCGGNADLCVYPASAALLGELLLFCRRESIPYLFLGVGANVLPREEDFHGVVIRFTNMAHLRREGNLITAGAGVTAGALCRYAREESLGGFEFLTGIPASLGGAVTMNAGVCGRHMEDCVVEVEGVGKDGKICRFSPEMCAFSEKSSVFSEGLAATQVVLSGEPRSREKILERTAYYAAKRAHLPKGRSMGCAFVNPAGQSAGALIEACGLKGKSVGGAYVSEQHANFIINGGATQREISELAALVQKTVFERTGILLREEFRRLP